MTDAKFAQACWAAGVRPKWKEGLGQPLSLMSSQMGWLVHRKAIGEGHKYNTISAHEAACLLERAMRDELWDASVFIAPDNAESCHNREALLAAYKAVKAS